jgi:predicted RNA methylase
MTIISKLINLYYELMSGINTRGVNSSSVKDGFHYATLGYRDIKIILDRMNLNKHDHFLDIGCGKGRIMAACSMFYKAQEVVGIEYDKTLYKYGMDNIEILKRKYNREIKITFADAINYDYRDITAIYMFNPFGDETLHECLKIIVESNTSPTLKIAYVNAKYKEVFKNHYYNYFEIDSEFIVDNHPVIIYKKIQYH